MDQTINQFNRQGDLRYQIDGSGSPVDNVGDQFNVDLGFTAAGNAMEQKGGEFFMFQFRVNSGINFLLGRSQNDSFRQRP